MANQVAARLVGDDYQHLFAWQYALDLLHDRKQVERVRVEDADALSVDDVTVVYRAELDLPNRFFQVKYHVDHREAYSTDAIIERKAGQRTSLLEKFWNTYNTLVRRLHGVVELTLVTNWGWDASDPFTNVIDGYDNHIDETFLTAGDRSDLGKIRAQWRTHLGVDDVALAPFIHSLRIRHGYNCVRELRDGVADRMENLGLRHDEAALHIATGIVRQWIVRGPSTIDRQVMEAVVRDNHLTMPVEPERAAIVVLNTIASPKFEVAPDYTLDWCAAFQDGSGKPLRCPADVTRWNSELLPQLRDLERHIHSETTNRLIRARGAARLSPWFALGFMFPEVAGYTIEVEQRVAGGRVERWRSDTPRASDFRMKTMSLPEGVGPFSGPSNALAVAIGVTDSIAGDVLRYLQQNSVAANLIVMEPEQGPSQSAFRSAGDVTAFAGEVKQLLRRFVREIVARRVLLFYCGPLSGACFLGHTMNAVASEILLMEDQQPGYAPSFLLP